MAEFQYKAFISYSHRDEAWATWLHKALESYRLPRKLVGSKGRHGTIPAKLFPVFRDRDELSSASDLSERVQAALRDSASLVVICSPASAASRWVNGEIRSFRALGRGDRIHCIVVDGDPQADRLEDSAFPPALLESEVGEAVEPLAADARKWADGKNLARLKLISGILGIRLDELRRRDQQRKRRLRAIAIAASLAVVALAATTIVSRLAENTRRQHAEALVSQLVEVSGELEKVADLQTLRSVGERLASYLDTLDQDDLSKASRIQVGMVLRQLGEVSKSQGRPEDAMDVFTRSRDAFASLVEDEPSDLSLLSELGKAEFWIAYIHLDRGDWDAASVPVRRYLHVTQQLAQAEPDNAEWAMELAYAHSNLGTIESRHVPVNPDKVLEHMQTAMEHNRRAAELAPDNEDYRLELADSHANLADAWLDVCDVGQALAARLVSVQDARDFHDLEPGNKRIKKSYAYALAGLASTQRAIGQTAEAMQSLVTSVGLLNELAREDPSNLTFRWNWHRKRASIAVLLALQGEAEASWSLSADVEGAMRQLLIEDQLVNVVNDTEFTEFLLAYSELAYRRGDRVLADKWLNEAIDRLRAILAATPDDKNALLTMSQAAYRYWVQNGQSFVSRQDLLPYAAPGRIENPRGCKEASIAARLAYAEGDNVAARDYTDYLMDKGFNEPAFRRFCSELELCE